MLQDLDSNGEAELEPQYRAFGPDDLRGMMTSNEGWQARELD